MQRALAWLLHRDVDLVVTAAPGLLDETAAESKAFSHVPCDLNLVPKVLAQFRTVAALQLVNTANQFASRTDWLGCDA